jgi:limonene 1,2-monooxygenase
LHGMSNGMKFGVFLAPYHRPDLNPTVAIERDIQLAERLDELGYDEIWYGEHHSSGVEIGGSPEMMISAAAQRTSRIKLGTGVISLPYHNPFMVADRIALLSHITKGRLAFGIGPGQLLTDARMLGIEPSTQRPRMEEALDIILRLLRGETVSQSSEWYDLHDAVLQLRPHSDFEVAVTSSFSPSGAQLAGKHGASMISLAASDPKGIHLLADHWSVAEAEAARSGKTVDRRDWRLMGRMYIAETLEQAKKDVEYGLPFLLDYLSHITPGAIGKYSSTSDLVDALNASGRGVVGTPEMAVAHLQNLKEKSGGFGTFLFQGSDYARWPGLLRSYELFAEEVAPVLNGQGASLKVSYDQVIASGTEGADTTARVQAEARHRYDSRRAELGSAGRGEQTRT